MNKRVIIAFILVIIWAGFIFAFSNMNGQESNSKSYDIVDKIIEIYDKITNANEEIVKYHQSFIFREKANYVFRKMCHAFVYFTLSILVFNLLITIFKKKLLIYNFLTLLICFIYAAIDEYHQTLVLERTGQFKDIIIDTFGAIIGCVFISSVYKLVLKSVNNKKINELF